MQDFNIHSIYRKEDGLGVLKKPRRYIEIDWLVNERCFICLYKFLGTLPIAPHTYCFLPSGPLYTTDILHQPCFLYKIRILQSFSEIKCWRSQISTTMGISEKAAKFNNSPCMPVKQNKYMKSKITDFYFIFYKII